ncbi:hypothetical protein ACWCXH_39060 [Kitasatospora sp. NPDC001660]
MTNPEKPRSPRTPGGIATARQVEALRRIEETGEAVAGSLPVRTFYPTDEAASHGVVAHFDYRPDDTWTVFGDLSRGPHGLVISRLEITPAEGSTGVTGGLLRKIPTGEILSAVRLKAAWESAQRDGTRALLGEEPVPGLFEEGDAAAPQRGGRTPITPDLLRQVAMAYLEETAPGTPSGAMKRMAERFGRPEETVRTWVTRARKDGWLGPGAKGRTGAEPGAKLLQWIGDAMTSSEAYMKEARRIAKDWGITSRGPVKAALIAYEDPTERDLSHRMGLPPLEASVAAQALFGKQLSAELASRAGQPGGSDESAFEELAGELRKEFGARGYKTP